eukprot:scaffold5209_cov272-Amphora_coffeaeformis.AAC.1
MMCSFFLLVVLCVGGAVGKHVDLVGGVLGKNDRHEPEQHQRQLPWRYRTGKISSSSSHGMNYNAKDYTNNKSGMMMASGNSYSAKGTYHDTDDYDTAKGEKSKPYRARESVSKSKSSHGKGKGMSMSKGKGKGNGSYYYHPE